MDRADGGFGETLRRYRLAAGLSQEALAERAGLSARGIRAQEGGTRGTPRLATVLMLADALGLGDGDRALLLAAARPAPTDRLAPRPSRLPAAPTPLVGREAEVAQGCTLLRRRGTRLLTLTGPGGVGKTRLALAIADGTASDFADGAYFIDLAPLHDPRQIAGAVAHAIGVREQPGQRPEDAIGVFVADRDLLLVIDNCEQVIEGMTLAARLLALAPNLKILATSRERLHLRGEHEFAVEPLAVPSEATAGASGRTDDLIGPGTFVEIPPLAGLANVAAVRLFAERAEEARLGFTLDDETAATVAAICRRLDGLPLAIELAAVQTRRHAPAVLLRRLDARLAVLTNGPRDLPDRQRTMRDAIAWSYELLSREEQALFRSLAVFAGGFTPAAAACVCGVVADDDRVHDQIADLASKSLLRADPQSGSGGERYRLLETVREFGLERLEDAGEAATAAARHAAHYLTFAEEAERNLMGPLERTWLEHLDADWANLRTVLVWAREHGRVEVAIRLAAALFSYWHRRGLLTEGRGWLDWVLASVTGENRESMPPESYAAARFGAAWYACTFGEWAEAIRHLDEAVAVRRTHGPAHDVAEALSVLAVAQVECDPDQAVATGREALRWCRSDPDERRLPVVLGNLATVYVRQGNLAEAEPLISEQLALEEARGYRRGVARSLADLGELEIVRGAWPAAAAHFRRAIPLMHAEGDWTSLSMCLTSLAISAALAGEPSAARLLGAADALGQRTGLGIWPFIAGPHERATAAATAMLGEAAYATDFATGRALPTEAAVEAALSGTVRSSGLLGGDSGVGGVRAG